MDSQCLGVTYVQIIFWSEVLHFFQAKICVMALFVKALVIKVVFFGNFCLSLKINLEHHERRPKLFITRILRDGKVLPLLSDAPTAVTDMKAELLLHNRTSTIRLYGFREKFQDR